MKEINEQIIERYMLSIERIRRITEEETTEVLYRDYFRKVSEFILKINEIRERMQDKPFEQCTLDELKRENESIYADVVGDQYDTSYANPAYAVSLFGEEIGQLLSFLYTELRGEIAYVYEQQVEYLAICNELFIEIYNCFEGTLTPDYKELKEIVYWYASDYCDVFVADRIEEQLNPECSFAADIVTKSNLNDLRYLYQYGEYVSENEWKTAEHLNTLPQKTIDQMADVYTEGYRIGFVNAGIDLSKKSVVNIRYTLGFERVIKKAIENFEKMGLRPTIYRAAVSVLTKRQHYKVGYYGAIANKQYEYDHRQDQGLFLDKKFMERKLDVMKNAYEKYRELAGEHAGPAVMEIFGEEPFAPVQKPESVVLTEKQEKLSVLFDSKSGQLTNQYIKGDERSFTIVAYPVPEIGAQYKEIFDEVIRINTLDANVYKNVQQALIDALDKGEYVHILGKDKNETDLKVQLYRLSDPAKETIFENCVADVNIPLGEVFTSPKLVGTNGILNVGTVYIGDIQYRNLLMEFKDGRVVSAVCDNFAENGEIDKEAGHRLIVQGIMNGHEILPLGEFAIGTNTTAYAMAEKFGILDRLPILIVEKMGPHFAVGDTCYSWSEDSPMYNPDGKEMIARDNEVSILRKEDVSKAYFGVHTDITIPYKELERISAVREDGTKVDLILDGRFVLAGLDELNRPLGEE